MNGRQKKCHQLIIIEGEEANGCNPDPKPEAQAARLFFKCSKIDFWKWTGTKSVAKSIARSIDGWKSVTK